MTLAVGSTIERYQVEEVIGEGGMAVVVKARHLQLGSLHAIKVLKDCKPSVAERVVQEGQLQSTLKHPNVVHVTDMLTVNGSPALVMEYVSGPTLAQLLRQFRPSLAQSDSIARGVMAGVAAAHKAGFIHRDLKPANILLSVEGGILVPKITDFGLAKALQPDLDAMAKQLTEQGMIMGTPAYMAPEQFENSSSVDARTDVFSLGAVLYELLTGDVCFKGDSVMEVWKRIASGEYPRVLDVNPTTPPRMVEAITAALLPDRDERVPTVSKLLELWCTGEDGLVVSLSDDQLRNSWTEVLAELRWTGLTPREHSPEVHATTYGALQSKLEPKSSEETSGNRRQRVTVATVIIAALAVGGMWMSQDTGGESDGTEARVTAVNVSLLRLRGQVSAEDRIAFARAKDALVAAKFVELRASLDKLSEVAAAQPAPALLWSTLAWFEGDEVASARASARAVAACKGRDDELAIWTRLFHQSLHAPGDRAALAQRWDKLGSGDDKDWSAGVIRAVAMAQLRPEAPPLLWFGRGAPEDIAGAKFPAACAVVGVRARRRAGGDVSDPLRAGLEAHPGHPELILEQAWASAASGDLDASAGHLKRLKPDQLAPRRHRLDAWLALRRGQEAPRMRALMAATSDALSPSAQVSWLLQHAADLGAHGRPQEAQKIINFARRQALKQGPAGAPLVVASARAHLRTATKTQAVDTWSGPMTALRNALKAPDLLALFRQQGEVELAVAEALVALGKADAGVATELRARLNEAPATPWTQEAAARLERAVTLSDGVAKQARERSLREMRRAVEAKSAPCDALLYQATLAASTGDAVASQASHQRVAEGSCRAPLPAQIWSRAQSLVALAEGAATRGDADAARAHLAAFGDTWPKREGSTPLDRRVAALQAKLKPANKAGSPAATSPAAASPAAASQRKPD